MRVSDAIRAASERLRATSDTARLDAELLMAHALGVGRSQMLLRHMVVPAPEGFAALVERRAAREPVAHITGVQEFYGRDFRVTPDTLIPRGDTETLIEAARDLAPGARRVLDLGTGSGALLVTALLELENAAGTAIDASPGALEIARANARSHGLANDRARFVLRDWTTHGWASDLGQFDLIVCNPPYVEAGARLQPDVRDYEPASALFAGADGLDDYRVLLPQLRALMADGAIALFEIGHLQGEAVMQLARDAGHTCEIRNDLANRPRCVVVR